jgi:hypothetical protein
VLAQVGPSRYAFYRAPQAAFSLPVGARAPLPRAAGSGGATPEAAAAPPVAVELMRSSEDEEKVRAALNAPTHFEFVDTPLSDAIAYLKDQHKIEIQLDARALGEVGIDAGTPITKKMSGVSLRSALRLLLREHSLTYLINDGVLMITTPEEADNQLITKIYPVGDLVLPPGAPEGSQPDFDSLIDLIKSTVKPTSWDDVGGAGSVSPFENRMSVVTSQTQEVHEEIGDLLRQLRSIGPPAGGWPKLKPNAARQKEKAQGARGGMGMGGMGGGMGAGMGGAPAPSPATAAGQPADLLEGVRDTNKGFQGKQSDKLNKMYQKGGGMGGMGGVGAGDAF